MEPRFELVDDEWVSVTTSDGVIKYNFKLWYGILPEDYVRIYRSMSVKYGLGDQGVFPKRLVEKRVVFGKEQEVATDSQDYPVEFVLNLSDLDTLHVDASPLVHEFNRINDIDGMRHTCSLSFIAAAYTLAGHQVEFPPRRKVGKNPDLLIDGLSADVKVRQSKDLERELCDRKSNAFKVTLGKELCLDIGSTIQNRVYDGIKQAEMLLVDLDKRSLPFMVIWDSESRIKGSIPEPRKARLVYFCRTKLLGDGQRYPLSATYVDFDPKLWEFIRDSGDKIEYRMFGGDKTLDKPGAQ